MTENCIYCKKNHESFNWKNIGAGWFCDRYYQPSTPEFIPDRLREERKQFAGDIVQPWRAGEASKEFIDRYPKKAKNLFTPTEIKKAKEVWRKDVKGL